MCLKTGLAKLKSSDGAEDTKRKNKIEKKTSAVEDGGLDSHKYMYFIIIYSTAKDEQSDNNQLMYSWFKKKKEELADGSKKGRESKPGHSQTCLPWSLS